MKQLLNKPFLELAMYYLLRKHEVGQLVKLQRQYFHHELLQKYLAPVTFPSLRASQEKEVREIEKLHHQLSSCRA